MTGRCILDLGINPGSADLRPVIEILTDSIHKYYREECRKIIHNMHSHIDDTYQEMTQPQHKLTT